MPAVNIIDRLAAALVAAGLCSSLACVDTGHKAKPGSCQVASPVATSDAGIPSTGPASSGPYVWKNVVIKGGGFVSGIVLSSALPGLAFARTDVGGAYRFDPMNQRWIAITDWVGHGTPNLS